MNILETMSDSGESIYLGFKTKLAAWQVGKETIEMEYMQVDFNTIATGWGRWVDGAGYEYYWDEQPGVVGQRPVNDSPEQPYKRAVSCWVQVHGIEKPLLWRTIGAGEREGFQSVLDLFWNDIGSNPDMLPTFKYTGVKVLNKTNAKATRTWQISVTQWDLVKWVARWEGFNLPAIDKNGTPVYDDQEPLIANGNVSFPPSEDLTEENIPF